MLDIIWETMGGPMLATALVVLVLVFFGVTRIAALGRLVARETVGKAARDEADPIAGLSFDERVAARLKELETAEKPAPSDPIPTAVSSEPVRRRGFGRRGAERA